MKGGVKWDEVLNIPCAIYNSFPGPGVSIFPDTWKRCTYTYISKPTTALIVIFRR